MLLLARLSGACSGWPSLNTLTTRTLLGAGGNGLRRNAGFALAIGLWFVLVIEPMAHSVGDIPGVDSRRRDLVNKTATFYWREP